MSSNRNITLSMPETLLKKAKVMAAKEEKSMSEFLRESLEEKIRRITGYNKARRRQIKFLNKGFDLGSRGKIKITRAEMHER